MCVSTIVFLIVYIFRFLGWGFIIACFKLVVQVVGVGVCLLLVCGFIWV